MNKNFIKSNDFTDFTIKEKPVKCILKIGNINILVDKKFNWFQRLMWKSCFGVKVIKW